MPGFLLLPHPLTNFEIQKYYQNERKFNTVYSRNNLPKVKDESYVINLDEFKSVGTHWIAVYVNAENVTYFDSFGVERILKEIRKFIWKRNVKTNIYRIQTSNSIMCGYFCIEFIDFMLKGITLLEYTNLFSTNEYKKHEKIMLTHFQ